MFKFFIRSLLTSALAAADEWLNSTAVGSEDHELAMLQRQAIEAAVNVTLAPNKEQAQRLAAFGFERIARRPGKLMVTNLDNQEEVDAAREKVKAKK